MKLLKKRLPPEVYDLAIRKVRDPNARIESRWVKEVEQVATGIRQAWMLAQENNRSPVPAEKVAKMIQTVPSLGGFARVSDNSLKAMHAAGMDWLGPFAPGSPLVPYIGESVPPRTYNFEVGRNLNIMARDGRIPYTTLQQIIDNYDIAQACIRYIISDLRSMPLTFKPIDKTQASGRKAVDEARKFWQRPDGTVLWEEWLAKWMYQVLAFDCGTLYRIRNEKGKLIGLRVIDGKTIVPKTDWWGNVGDQLVYPEGVEEALPAYQQVIEGVPWDNFTRDDIYYPLMWPRPDSVYGWPPIESVLMNANTDLRMQAFFLQFFTSGAVPEALLIAPEHLSDPAVIERLQEVWDSVMSGDPTRRFGGIYLPGGTQVHQMEMPKYPEELWHQIMRLTVMQFNLLPINLGFTDSVNRATSGTQMDLQERVGTLAYTTFVSRFLTWITQEDLELPVIVDFDTARDREDRLKEAQAWKAWVDMGAASADDAREHGLGLPIDPALPTPRFLVAGNGIVPVGQIIATGGVIDPHTGNPAQRPQPEEYVWPTQHAPDPQAPQNPSAHQQHTPIQPMIGGAPPPMKTNTQKATILFAHIACYYKDRIYIQQRGVAINDPAQGLWEIPGGHLDEGETPWEAAVREWEEEVGVPLPPGRRKHASLGGQHMLYCYEADEQFDLSKRKPHNTEASGNPIRVAWATVDEIRGLGRQVRPELIRDLTLIQTYMHLDDMEHELAQFHRLAETHSLNVLAANASKPWRFEWHHVPPSLGKALEQGVLQEHHAEHDKKTQELAPVVFAALSQIVSAEDAQKAIYQFTSQAPQSMDYKDKDVLAVYADAMASALPLNFTPLREAIERVHQAGTVLGGGVAGEIGNSIAGILNFNHPYEPTIEAVTIKRLGEAIATGLENDESAWGIAQRIVGVCRDWKRAVVIVKTELSKFENAIREKLIRHHEEQTGDGVVRGETMLNLLTMPDACPICKAIAASNPHPISDQSIMPPIHPNCRCVVVGA